MISIILTGKARLSFFFLQPSIFIDSLEISYQAPWSHSLPSSFISAPVNYNPSKVKNKNQKIRKKNQTSPICVPYILTGAWSTSQWPAPSIELSPSSPTPLPEAISCGVLHFLTATWGHHNIQVRAAEVQIQTLKSTKYFSTLCSGWSSQPVLMLIATRGLTLDMAILKALNMVHLSKQSQVVGEETKIITLEFFRNEACCWS